MEKDRFCFQTPYTKMHIPLESRLQTYGDAVRAAQDLKSHGYQVTMAANNKNDTRDIGTAE